ncbi:protein kinase domain-containing protein [Planctomycetaceae bacterium SH139]
MISIEKRDGEDVRTETLQPLTKSTEATSGDARPIGGRYKLLERLGSGGMATVHRARDLQRDCDVAIKFMNSDLGGTARRRFFREFNTIAGIDHPCCLRVFEIGETHEAPYFTMELHPGQSVTTVFGEAPGDIAAMLIDVTLAIDYIHSQGIVHRDIKPSNILVQGTGGDSDRRITAKLADFGLAKFFQLDSSLTAERGLVGTPAYCAPEQIEGGQVDHRVDLYALGVLAYELLSGGVHPFAQQRENGVSALLQAQLSSMPPPLINEKYPLREKLAKIVAAYLEKDVEKRPASAGLLRKALVDDYGIVVEARLEQMSTPSAVHLNALGFVCRDAELEIARQFLRANLHANEANAQASAEEQSTLLVISGEPGAGKSSIMQEIARRAIGSGCRVYEGRCFDGNASAFQPFVEIIRQIFIGLRRKTHTVDDSTMLVEGITRHVNENNQIEKILLDYQQELLRIAPELRRWLQAEAQQPAFRNDSDYIVRALATMLIEISQVRPLCLCFDDVQWADQSSLALLQHLAVTLRRQSSHNDLSQERQPTGLKPSALVLVCTGRSGYERLDAFLAKAEIHSQFHVIDVAVFGREETRQMLALRLGCLPGQVENSLVETIDKLCHGNPFFISETVREWHANGVIARTPDGWQLLNQSHDDSSLPTSVRSALRGRMAELSEATRAILPVAAAMGRIIDLDLLSEVLSDVSESGLLDGIDELLTKRIFVETHAASRLEFSHDLMREMVFSEIASTRRRSIHRRIAEAIEARLAPTTKFAPNALLAMHFQAGEVPAKAFEYSMKAGADAMNAYAFADALEHLRRAEESQPQDLNSQAKLRLYNLLAEAHSGCEQLGKAILAARSAQTFATSNFEVGEVIARLAWYHQKQGDSREAMKLYDEALTCLGAKRAKQIPFVILSIQLNLFLFHLVPLPILKFYLRRRTSDDRVTELLCLAYFDFAYLMGSRNLFVYLQLCTLNAVTSRLTSSPNAKCQALAKYGLNLGFSGVTLLSLRYAKQATQAAKDASRPEIAASGRTSVSACLLFAGRLDEAEREVMDAIVVLDRCGDHHLSLAYHWLVHIKSVRGRSDEIIDVAEKELAVAKKTRDNELMAYGHYGIAHGLALNGQFDRAVEAGEKSIQLLAQTDSAFLALARMEYGFALMQASRYEEAVESLQAALAIMNRYLHYFEIHMPLFPRLGEAILGPEWCVFGHLSKKTIRSAGRYVRRARLFSLLFPNIRPHTWRIRGRLHFAQGKINRARKCFGRAIAEAEKLGAHYDKARALYDLSIADPGQRQLRQSALTLLDELHSVIPAAEQRHE